MTTGLQDSEGIRAEPTDRTAQNLRLDDLKGDGIFDAKHGFAKGRDIGRVEWIINV